LGRTSFALSWPPIANQGRRPLEIRQVVPVARGPTWTPPTRSHRPRPNSAAHPVGPRAQGAQEDRLDSLLPRPTRAYQHPAGRPVRRRSPAGRQPNEPRQNAASTNRSGQVRIGIVQPAPTTDSRFAPPQTRRPARRTFSSDARPPRPRRRRPRPAVRSREAETLANHPYLTQGRPDRASPRSTTAPISGTKPTTGRPWPDRTPATQGE